MLQQERIYIANMDVSSRRAFPLDSRTVWVEQQLVHGTLLARDNLPLGPGEYSLSGLSRHVSSPVFGKPRDQADFLPSFNSPTSRRMRAASPPNVTFVSEQNTPMKRLQSPTQSQLRHLQDNSMSAEERSEFKTIFHEGEKRDPFDTNRRYCTTPGPYLAHDSILETVKSDGKHTVRGALPFGPNSVPFGARMEYKLALPTYDVKYDSKHLKPIPKLGSFPKEKRIDIPEKKMTKSTDDIGRNTLKIQIQSDSKAENSHSFSPTGPSSSPTQAKSISIAEIRSGLVRLPIVKRKPITKVEFNDESYRKGKKQTVLNMTPSLMRSEIKDRVFDKLLAIPRQHKAPGLKMSLKSSLQDD